MPKSLFNFFNPKSIGVVGASNNLKKVGGIIFNNILNSNFKGQVYPININEDEVLGKKAHKNIDDLKEEVDLVLVAVPAASTIEILNSKKHHNFVLYASGFKEIGNEGKEVSEKLENINLRNEIKFLGPNCFGFVNNDLSLNTTFGKSSSKSGNIKFISQSGAIASSFFDFSLKNNVGFSEFITIGNKTNINEIDVLNYFDEMSKKEGGNFSIGLYLESISNGPEFLKVIQKLINKHKIFILKPGKTKISQSAMMSHTASLAGDDTVLDQVLSQLGVIRCQTLGEFFDLSMILSSQKIPHNNKIITISNAGGPSVQTSDFANLHGFEYELLPKEILENLKNSLPPSVSFSNPIDLVGDADANRFNIASNIIFKNSISDTVLFIITPQLSTQIKETIEVILKFKDSPKFIAVSLIGGSVFDEARMILRNEGIAVFDFPEDAIKAISMISPQKSISLPTIQNNFEQNKSISSIVSKNIKNLSFSIDTLDSLNICEILGFRIPNSFYLNSKNIERIEFPIILKITSPDILHKKDIGGISKIVFNKKDLISEIKILEKNISRLKKQGIKEINILAQEVIKPGTEIILGCKKDSVFGNIIFVGLGGSFVNVLDDRNIILPFINKKYIEDVLQNSKLNKVLIKENLDLKNVTQEIIKFSQIIGNMAEIQEIEINPLIINSDGIFAVDPKVILNKNKKDEK